MTIPVICYGAAVVLLSATDSVEAFLDSSPPGVGRGGGGGRDSLTVRPGKVRQQQQQQQHHPPLSKTFLHPFGLDDHHEWLFFPEAHHPLVAGDRGGSNAVVESLLSPRDESGIVPQRAPSVVATAATSSTAADLELESEVLLDASHLCLDFSVFVTRSRSILQVAQVVGRVLLLVQDYLPDRHVSPEELVVQVGLIAVCLSKRNGIGGNNDDDDDGSNRHNHRGDNGGSTGRQGEKTPKATASESESTSLQTESLFRD